MAFIAVGLFLATAVASCAKREVEDTTKLEQSTLDAWVEKYVTGQGISAVRQSNGVWVEFIEDGNQSVEAARDTAVWLRLDYTSTDIDGNIFATRDSIEALRQRTYSPYTYYVPEYLYCGDANYNMAEGQYFALRSDLTKPDGTTIKLSEGSHVRLYIPSYLAYGSGTFTNDQGYGGQYPLGGTRIMVQDLTVKGVVKNPLTHEEKIVTDYAMQKWGKVETDTLAPCFYVDTIGFRPSAALLADFPNKPFVKEYSLTVDSTATIWYVGRFLPTPEYPEGFIFDTNIPSIHEKFYNRRANEEYRVPYKTLKALSYKPVDDQNSTIAAFYRAVPELRRGQWSRMVFPSAYGYGATGMSKALQNQQQQLNSLMSLYSYGSMFSSRYGSSYGGYGGYGYGDYGYGGYGYGYNSYLNSSMSTSSEDTQSVVTEIQPYTPLIFEIYIEVDDDEE